MISQPIDDLPGYRRRIRVDAVDGAVRAMLEDDFHCMAVTLRHCGGVVTAVEPVMDRAPWTTCPGAAARLVATFAGLPLGEVTARREKRENCTHLHDLAVLAAAHAGQRGGFAYDILAADPVAGERVLELRRDGAVLLCWTEREGVLVAPEAVAGCTLFTLRDRIASLAEAEQEPARLLQWAAMVAHGRLIPMDRQSRAADMPANCFTFQPERAGQAVRVGASVDFSGGSRVPLDQFGASESVRLTEV
jgi:hypothetical protein